MSNKQTEEKKHYPRCKKHCKIVHPCPCCENLVCIDCQEPIATPYSNITDKTQIWSLAEAELLFMAVWCLECIFYAFHDINNPEQEEYNHEMIFEVTPEKNIKILGEKKCHSTHSH